MPLLLLPLLVIGLVLVWLLLWPFALWQRYRAGRARRRAVAWVAGFNAWSLLVSVLVFLFSAGLTGYWVDGALRYAAMGVGAGVLLGVFGLKLTHFETTPQGLYYTANRWLVLTLTLVVAARITYSLYRMEQAWNAGVHEVWVSQQGSVFAVGGLLLGHYLAYAWGLRWRLRRRD